jgi:PhnB protein
MSVNPIRKGYRTVTPYLVVEGVPGLLEFLKGAFKAVEISRHLGPGGRVMHAEITIGDSIVMMGEAGGPFPARPSCLYLYTEDTDAAYRASLAAGGKSIQEPADQFYGDRTAGVEDPSGNQWWIATHIEDLSEEEMARRSEAFNKQMAERKNQTA